MNNQSVSEGQSVTFTAEASGVPVPMLSWQKDGRQIYPGGDHYQIHTEGNRSTLYIASVRPDDDAWYQCTAASVSGTATNRVRLHIVIGQHQSSPRLDSKAVNTCKTKKNVLQKFTVLLYVVTTSATEIKKVLAAQDVLQFL